MSINARVNAIRKTLDKRNTPAISEEVVTLRAYLNRDPAVFAALPPGKPGSLHYFLTHDPKPPGKPS